jgi:hypothetical protein
MTQKSTLRTQRRKVIINLGAIAALQAVTQKSTHRI